MRLYSISILIVILFFNCSSDVYAQTVKMQQSFITDLLKLELTIGGEDDTHKKEYLLVHPSGIAVNDSGDIFVMDESRIKVFDKNGDEKRIIGGPGQGPGKFGILDFAHIAISPTNYLTVFYNGTYHLFSPEYEFLRSVNIRFDQRFKDLVKNLNFKSKGIDPLNFTFIDKDELVFLLFGLIEGNEEMHDFFIYYSPEIFKVLSIQRNTSFIPGGINTPYLGRLYSDILPGRKIIYTHAGDDYEIKNDSAYYILHIVSLDTYQDTKITHPYDQIKFPDSVINKYAAGYGGKSAKRIFEAKKYYAPVRHIKTDDNIIFVFTYKTKNENECLADIFEARSAQHIKSLYLPLWFTHSHYSEKSIIKYGYIYRITASEGEFAKIRRYKLNPAVYGK